MARIGMTLSVPDKAGAARMCFYYAQALKERGHEVVLLHGPPHDSADQGDILAEFRCAGVHLKAVPILSRPFPPLARMSLARAAAGCELLIGVNQRDRVVAIAAAHDMGVPVALSVQNQHNFWGPLVVPHLKRLHYVQALKGSEVRCICTSDVVRNEIVSMGVPPNNAYTLHNGVEVSRYAPNPSMAARFRAEIGMASTGRMLVNVGRLDVQKGQDLLLQAWNRADPTEADRLVLVGDVTAGNQRSRSSAFKRQLQALRENARRPSSIVFAGWRDDIRAPLSAADAYVHSARWEGWPLTVVEAMSASLPIIMTDCSGLPNGFNQGRQGLVVETNNVDQLAAAIREFLTCPSRELKVMGQAGHALATEHYDIAGVGAKFAGLVEELLDSSRAQPPSR